MPRSALDQPQLDPTPVFDLARGNFATELLTAAVAHFNVFGILASGPMSMSELRGQLKLEERPATVLITALRAMSLLVTDQTGRLTLSPLAVEHLTPGGQFEVGDYVSLMAAAPGVHELVRRLRTNRPAGIEAQEPGAAFIFRAGVPSAMEQSALARHFTLALAGRAKNVAPVLAATVPLPDARVLLDVAGGTGIYSIAFLQKNPQLRAIVLDRPEVLKVTAEFAEEYGVADRLECRAGDMFGDVQLPDADIILLSNVLHDWDIPECRGLVARCAQALAPGGQLLIHDAFLNDALDGPLPIALYSAALFSLTEGRAYSAAEYRGWVQEAGLIPSVPLPTLVHGSVLCSAKPGGQ